MPGNTGSGRGSVGTGNGECDKEQEEGIPGPSKSLGQGEKGDFNAANAEWDAKIQTVKEEFGSKIDEYKGLFSGVFNLNLSSSGGSLMCVNITLPAQLLAASAVAAIIILKN